MFESTKASCPHTILGVAGHLFRDDRISNGLLKKQVWKATRKLKPSLAKWIKRNEDKIITVSLRFDDQCGNRFQNFSITCNYGGERDGGGGAAHEIIVDHFPELEPLVQWHLSSTKSAMEMQNALYFAGNRDCNGRAHGEPESWQDVAWFDGCPVPYLVDTYSGTWRWIKEAYQFNCDLVEKYGKAAANNPKFTLFAVRIVPYGKEDPNNTYRAKYCFEDSPTDAWHRAAFDYRESASGFAEALNRRTVRFDRIVRQLSKGKPRELDLARLAARWPDATEEQLSAPRHELLTALQRREVEVNAAFKKAMTEDCGFLWFEIEPEVQS